MAPLFEIWCAGGAVTRGKAVGFSAKYTERFWRDKDAEGKPFLTREAAEQEAARLGTKHGMAFSVRPARTK